MPTTPADRLMLAPPDRRRRAELYDLIAKVFSGGRGYFGFLDYITRGGYIESGHYDWSASRVGWLDGRMVTHVGVWDYQMRIGSARVRSGGLGVVGTHGQLRKQGLMARSMGATIDAMRRGGYDVSVLFGIGGFYHRFGYTRAWNASSWTVKVADLPSEPPVGRIRSFVPRPRADLDALYNRHYATVTGTAVRPTYARRPRQTSDRGWLWTGRAGKPVGYIVVQGWPDKPELVEQVGDVRGVLAVLGAQCRRIRVKEIKIVDLPWDSPLARRLRTGNAQLTVEYVRSGRAMIRIVNLGSTLDKLSGELAVRMTRAGAGPWRGRLRVELADMAGDLVWRGRRIVTLPPRGKALHGIRGGWDVGQLLIGADEPLEIADSYGIRLGGLARAILPILLPNQHPLIGRADRF